MKIIRKFLVFPRFIYFFLPILIISLLFINFPTSAVTLTGTDFIGQAILPTGLTFEKTNVGGLSGITYDRKKKVYYAISDDRSQKAPARFYTLKIDLSKGFLKNGDVVPVGVTTLINKSGKTFPSGEIDPEGIAFTRKGTVFISSEGDAEKLINPFIKEFSLSSGREIKTLPIPTKFLPDKNRRKGIRNNLAFESLTITPDEKNLFTASENALIQDGPEAQSNVSSPCRILQYNLRNKQPQQEFLYPTEAVTPFLKLLSFSQNFSSGLPDLLALDNRGNFLSIERSFTGVGFSIALFQISLKGADDIHKINSILQVNTKTIKPVQKKMLLDLRNLNVLLDNIEGLTLGPRLPDGQPSLILISDNNFNSMQRTQILAFRLRMESPIMRLFRRLVPN